MTCFKDLTPYEYLADREPLTPKPLNIGWLGVQIPFETGLTPQEFKNKLLRFCLDQYIVLITRGFHACEFCWFPWTQWDEYDQEDRYGSSAHWASIGNGEIRVLGKSAVYAAPALVYHYVVEHQYKPPDEFIEAILTGEPDSEEQTRLLSKYKGRHIQTRSSMNTHPLLIRDERETDIAAIHDITLAAFADMEISSHTEQFVIQALRAAKALTISLVAEVEGRVVGHIAFSPVTMTDGAQGWYGLGPVSVHPSFQRRGVGKALIREGLSRLKVLNASGCCLVGHPQYYRQFGFENVEGLSHEGVPQEFFFVLSFNGIIPRGQAVFHEAFKAGAPPAEG